MLYTYLAIYPVNEKQQGQKKKTQTCRKTTRNRAGLEGQKQS